MAFCKRKKLIDVAVVECAMNKLSEKSIKNLLNNFHGDLKKGELAMATIEIASMCDIGRIFCSACYKAEGNSPLILTLSMILKKIENTIESGGYDVTTLERVVNDCVSMFEDARDYFMNSILRVKSDFKKKRISIRKIRLLNQLENELKNITYQVGPNGRMRKRNRIHVDQELVEKLEADIQQASIEKEKATDMFTTCKILLAEERANLTNWEKNSHIVTRKVSLSTVRVLVYLH